MSNLLVIQILLFLIAYLSDVVKSLSIAKGVIADKAKYIHEGEIPTFREYVKFSELFLFLNRKISIFFLFGVLIAKETFIIKEVNEINIFLIILLVIIYFTFTLSWSLLIYQENGDKKINEIYKDTITHLNK